jgi:hypothetical protein
MHVIVRALLLPWIVTFAAAAGVVKLNTKADTFEAVVAALKNQGLLHPAATEAALAVAMNEVASVFDGIEGSAATQSVTAKSPIEKFDAGKGDPAEAPAARETPPVSPAAAKRLADLEQVFAAGLVTEAEMRAKRDAILADAAPASVTVVVPALARDVGMLTRLKHSMDIQTLAPNEVIVVISGMEDKHCPSFHNWTIMCEKPILFAGTARNIGWRMATSDVVTFLDADDQMYPERIKTIATHFVGHDLQLLLHGFSTTPIKDHVPMTQCPAKDGHWLFQETRRTQNRHLWISAFIHHGHASVRRRISCEPFPKQKRGQDSLFVRRCINHLGDNRDAMVALNCPLSLYIPGDIRRAHPPPSL